LGEESKQTAPSLSPDTDIVEYILGKEIPRFSVVLASLLQVLVIVLIIVFATIDLYIDKPGLLSNKDHLLYITGTTILATIVASFTTSTIRNLCLYL
jgi:hypothetical protein